MQRTEFIERVRRDGDLDSNEDAETVTVSTLQTLSDRIAEGQAEDIADELPDELAGTLSVEGGQATELTVEQFLERVATDEQEASIEGDTENHVRAVLSTLEATIDDEESRALREQLPESYERLF